MKFIAYSDPHIHPHQGYSKPRPDGMNSRLVDTLDAVGNIYRDANELKIPVVSGGDTFQVKNSVNVLAFNEFSRILAARAPYAEVEHPDIINIGNHDIATHDGSRHALEPLSNYPAIVIPSDPAGSATFVYWGDGILFTVIPYPMKNGRFSEEKFKHVLSDAIRAQGKMSLTVTTSILLSHLFTHELMAKHLDRSGDYSGKELLNHFDLVLLGHHHIHDVITGPEDKYGRTKKVISIGSPIQLTAAERGEKKGYLIVDTDTLDFEFVPLAAPEFHYFDGEKDIIPEKIEGDFVKVKVKTKAEATRVETKLKRAGVEEFRIEITPEKVEARIDLPAGAKDDVIIDKYITSEWGKTTLDVDRLKKMGMEFLR